MHLIFALLQEAPAESGNGQTVIRIGSAVQQKPGNLVVAILHRDEQRAASIHGSFTDVCARGNQDPHRIEGALPGRKQERCETAHRVARGLPVAPKPPETQTVPSYGSYDFGLSFEVGAIIE